MLKSTETLTEGFPNQKLLHVSVQSIQRMKALPLCQTLYVTDAGHFPEALNHKVHRVSGSKNYILIFCLSGSGYITIDGKTEIVEENHAIIIPAKKEHEYGSKINNSWSLYWVHFNGSEAKELCDLLTNSGESATLFMPQSTHLIKAFETTIRWVQKAQTDNALISLTCTFTNLIGLVFELKRSKTKKIRQAEERIRASLQTMEQTLRIPLTLEQLAEDAQMSVPHYCSLFKKQTGSTPIQVYAKFRIRAACHLLASTQLTVKQVASEVGYEDAYYFSRAFKKVMGISPNFYRRNVTLM